MLEGPIELASIEAFVERELGVPDVLSRADLDVRAADPVETRAIRALPLR